MIDMPTEVGQWTQAFRIFLRRVNGPKSDPWHGNGIGDPIDISYTYSLSFQ